MSPDHPVFPVHAEGPTPRASSERNPCARSPAHLPPPSTASARDGARHQFLDSLISGLFFRRAGALQGGALLVECRNRILGARQCGLLRGKGASERRGALHQRGPRLVYFLEFGFALHSLGFELGNAGLQRITFHCEFGGPPVVCANLVSACKQMFARFAQQLFACSGPRMQGVEAHALRGEFVRVAFVGLVQCIGLNSAKFPSTWGNRPCVAVRPASASASLRDTLAASALILSIEICCVRFSSSIINSR